MERLEETDFHKLYGLILVYVRQVYQFQSKCCHADTTYIVVFGNYDDPNQTLVNYGFSKDKRFDLKQIKSGLCVNSDGFPIYREPVNGNEDDKTWSNELLKKFKDVVNSELSQILVADSQLITTDNLKLRYMKSISFISRLPDTFGISEDLKELAWRETIGKKLDKSLKRLVRRLTRSRSSPVKSKELHIVS